MKKRLFSILALVCLVCSLLCACEKKEEITGDQAAAIVLEALGENAKNVGTPHVHPGTHNNKDCYNVYVTVDGESWVYIVSYDGEILAMGPGSHSH